MADVKVALVPGNQDEPFRESTTLNVTTLSRRVPRKRGPPFRGVLWMNCPWMR